MKVKYEVSMNGVDRADPSLGYIPTNCVPCCAMCNMMKNGYGQEAFIAKVKQIAQNLYRTGAVSAVEDVETPAVAGSVKRQVSTTR